MCTSFVFLCSPLAHGILRSSWIPIVPGPHMDSPTRTADTPSVYEAVRYRARLTLPPLVSVDTTFRYYDSNSRIFPCARPFFLDSSSSATPNSSRTTQISTLMIMILILCCLMFCSPLQVPLWCLKCLFQQGSWISTSISQFQRPFDRLGSFDASIHFCPITTGSPAKSSTVTTLMMSTTWQFWSTRTD